MPSAGKRAVAKAALGFAAAASLSSNAGVSAFCTFPPLARSLGNHQSTASPSTMARGHRYYVRDRSGTVKCMGSRQEAGASAGALSGVKTFLAAARERGYDDRRSRTSLSMQPDEGGAGSTTGEVEAFMPAPLQEALPEGFQVELAKINNDPAKLALALNAGVIFLFAAFAAFKLATVDGDIARGWTWYEVLLRVPGDNFYRYEATVSENPIVTKALTSCVAYGLGDLTAQLFTGRDLETIDLTRTARSATAGLLVHGPLCHYWIQLMQTYLDFDGAWWNFIPKVIADQTVWSIFLNAAYSTMIMSLQGMSPDNVWEQVKTTAWPALTSSWRFWPLIHCVSFSNAIPTDLKLLFIDSMEIIWVTILSTVANKDRQGDDEGGMDDGSGTPALATAEDGGSAGGSAKIASLQQTEVVNQ